jgi:hypothetical protein
MATAGFCGSRLDSLRHSSGQLSAKMYAQTTKRMARGIRNTPSTAAHHQRSAVSPLFRERSAASGDSAANTNISG